MTIHRYKAVTRLYTHTPPFPHCQRFHSATGPPGVMLRRMIGSLLVLIRFISMPIGPGQNRSSSSMVPDRIILHSYMKLRARGPATRHLGPGRAGLTWSHLVTER